MKAMLAEQEPASRAVILDASAQDEIDVTSTEVLIGLGKHLRGNGIDVYLADVHAPVLEHARQSGLIGSIGEDHVFVSVDAAVRHLEQDPTD
jgi:MFS superfamily sulfate permease-like transporter